MFDALQPYATVVKIVAVAIIAALISFATWRVASDHYGKIIAEMQAAQALAVSEAQAQQLSDAAARSKLINDAGDQHAKDQLHINALTSQLNSVRIHFPSGRSMPQSGSAPGDSDGACRMAAARADEYMAEAQRAIDSIGQRCAQLNIDAIQANAVR